MAGRHNAGVSGISCAAGGRSSIEYGSGGEEIEYGSGGEESA
jgi:hypothetical protein